MSESAIDGLKPEIIWKRFYEISQVPRPSKKEEKILNHLKNLAKELNIKYKEDKVGNLVFLFPQQKVMKILPQLYCKGMLIWFVKKIKTLNMILKMIL